MPLEDQVSTAQDTCNDGAFTFIRALMGAISVYFRPATSPQTLRFTRRNGHVEVARCLLDGRADLHQTLTNGVSPLASAAHKGHMQVTDLLIQAWRPGSSLFLVVFCFPSADSPSSPSPPPPSPPSPSHLHLFQDVQGLD